MTAPGRVATRTAPAPWWRPWAWFPARWHDIDATRDPSARFGSFERWLLVVASVVLVLQRFPASGDHLAFWVGEDSRWFELADDLQWSLGSALAYVVLPLAHVRLAGRRIVDACNLSLAGTGRHLGVYAGLFVAMLVPVAIVAGDPDFARIYPFYPHAGRSWFDLGVWAVAYATQFVALELFFRGYLVEGLRRTLGSGAIFVMCVPYVMLHFGKTALESIAALVAGVVLGTLAMHWRSIWGGALLHVGVAWTMDGVQILRDGDFPPPVWFP